MRILVYGGRDYTDREAVFLALDHCRARRQISVILHGACLDNGRQDKRGVDRYRGADALADQWAFERGIPVDPFPADWRRHRKSAGPIRNRAMVRSGVDGAIEFPGGNGTADMRKQLTAAGVQIWVPLASPGWRRSTGPLDTVRVTP